MLYFNKTYQEQLSSLEKDVQQFIINEQEFLNFDDKFKLIMLINHEAILDKKTLNTFLKQLYESHHNTVLFKTRLNHFRILLYLKYGKPFIDSFNEYFYIGLEETFPLNKNTKQHLLQTIPELPLLFFIQQQLFNLKYINNSSFINNINKTFSSSPPSSSSSS